MDPNTTDPSKLFSVKDLVVVITGGGTGIGLMMTKAFASNGAHKVYIVGRRKEPLEETAKSCNEGIGNVVVPVVGDVSSKESLMGIAEQVKREVGWVDLVCCNSGIYGPKIGVKSKTFAINTTGVAFTAFAFLTLLYAGNERRPNNSPKSQILVTTSIAGYLRNPNTFGCYPISKGAVTHLIKGLSGTLAPYAIRVNGLAPGLFPSDLAESLIASGGDSQGDPCVEGAFQRSFIPAERLGSTADMAGTVLYVASQAGAYLNGNIMVIDGGRITQLPGTY